MTNQPKTAINVEELIPGLDPVPEDDEILKNKLFIKEQKDKNKIPEELTNRYFEILNSSVLPF